MLRLPPRLPVLARVRVQLRVRRRPPRQLNRVVLLSRFGCCGSVASVGRAHCVVDCRRRHAHRAPRRYAFWHRERSGWRFRAGTRVDAGHLSEQSFGIRRQHECAALGCRASHSECVGGLRHRAERSVCRDSSSVRFVAWWRCSAGRLGHSRAGSLAVSFRRLRQAARLRAQAATPHFSLVYASWRHSFRNRVGCWKRAMPSLQHCRHAWATSQRRLRSRPLRRRHSLRPRQPLPPVEAAPPPVAEATPPAGEATPPATESPAQAETPPPAQEAQPAPPVKRPDSRSHG